MKPLLTATAEWFINSQKFIRQTDTSAASSKQSRSGAIWLVTAPLHTKIICEKVNKIRIIDKGWLCYWFRSVQRETFMLLDANKTQIRPQKWEIPLIWLFNEMYCVFLQKHIGSVIEDGNCRHLDLCWITGNSLFSQVEKNMSGIQSFHITLKYSVRFQFVLASSTSTWTAFLCCKIAMQYKIIFLNYRLVYTATCNIVKLWSCWSLHIKYWKVTLSFDYQWRKTVSISQWRSEMCLMT